MISIIIPTLNEQKIIEKMLLSLKKFNAFEYEIIVSDGHSTDKTVEIAKKYADKVIVYNGITKQTIAGGRNAGANVAKGKYLIFLDADVFIPKSNEFLTRAVSNFEKNKKLLALTVKLKTLAEYETLGDCISFTLINYGHQFTNNILHRGTSSGEFQMFRTDVFRKTGGYNEKIIAGEDLEIFQRLSKIGQTRFDPQLCVLHTSRRAHDIGWFHLWYLWSINFISVIIRKKAVSKEWKISR